MFILIILITCFIVFLISNYLHNYLLAKQQKTDILEAIIFYLFFFRLISVALIIGFVLYWIAGVF
jgi:hypothetical protein|tara:strand:+ start:242 stop:436 length:195 start_codon:yes stop_codon:yes gene_type:complete